MKMVCGKTWQGWTHSWHVKLLSCNSCIIALKQIFNLTKAPCPLLLKFVMYAMQTNVSRIWLSNKQYCSKVWGQ